DGRWVAGGGGGEGPEGTRAAAGEGSGSTEESSSEAPDPRRSLPLEGTANVDHVDARRCGTLRPLIQGAELLQHRRLVGPSRACCLAIRRPPRFLVPILAVLREVAHLSPPRRVPEGTAQHGLIRRGLSARPAGRSEAASARSTDLL